MDKVEQVVWSLADMGIGFVLGALWGRARSGFFKRAR